MKSEVENDRFRAKAKVHTVVALLVLLNAGITFGQVVTGTILGRVTDSTGAVVAGATVQIQNLDTGFSQTAQTDSEGRYLSRNLPLGSYSVTVQQAGFRTEVRRGISLSVASEVTVNVGLAVGNVQEKVEVTAEAPVIETTNATLSGLVTPDQMRDLPLNGRSIADLALLSPGVFASRSTLNVVSLGFGLRLSVNGGRQDANLYLLDGTVVSDHSVSGPNSAAGGASLGVEGILEFRLLTHNFSAEYGRNSGSVMSMVTRSGTNAFHGSAYEFVRNNIFDARNFFNPSDLPAFRRNQFGAALGGRLIKDRVFLFANYEGLRQRQGITKIATVPDANARLGLVPDPNTHQLVPVNLNSAVVPYLNLYPLPNGRNFGDGTAQYITDFSQAANEDYSMERMDFRLSDKDNFYWRYVFDSSSSVIPRPLPTFVEAITQGNHFVTLSETHIFSGTSLNEFRFGFNRTDPISDAKSLVPIDPSLSFVPGQPFGIIRQGGTGLVGQLVEMGRLFTAQNYAQNLFQETDTFSTVRGAHSLKFGADVERIQLNLNSGSTAGNYLFTGLRSLLAGQPTQFSVTLLGGTSTLVRTWRRNLFAWFVQDDFRLRPNLTLNLGLRHEFFTTPTELHGRSAALLHVTDPEVTPGPPFISSKTNFSPRVGLAWDPTGTGKTSVRLGAGMFYNLTDGRNWYMAAGAGPQFTTSVTVNDPPFPNGLASGFALGRPSVSGLEQHPNEPTVIHYNLEVQRQLARTLSLRVGYVGSDGYHMQRLTYQNIRIPQILGDGSKSFPATGPVVNPNFADITKVLTDAHYNYNALQAVLQKTVSAGLQFQASYTFSKAMSDADEVGNAQTTAASPTTLDLSNLARDYSLSVYDQRQTLVLSGRYAIPWDKRLNGRAAKAALGGWAVNGIYSYGSGLPTNVNTGFNNSRSGDLMVTDRPDLAPGASNNPIQGVTAGCQGIPAGQKLGTPDRWYDPCAFVLQRAGTFGNLGRNTVIGPGLSSVDFTLVKSTSLAEKKQLEFRAEFFNLLNHAKFGLPLRNVFSSSGLRSGNGGVITSTATSNREVQLGLKLIF